MIKANITDQGLLPNSIAHGIGSQVQRPLAIDVVGGNIDNTLITPLLLKFVKTEEQ
ncbi:MAG TPA: hypothetical protein VEI57_09635 [Nitrospirota bacterium]|nr:hypothetical protein [Nitrospirota bacterium]